MEMNNACGQSASEDRQNKWPLLGRPCPGCPWRCDTDASDIPNFSIEKARGLVATSPDEKGHGPDFGSPLFACHQSKEGGEIACAGWLAAVGHVHPNVRLAVLRGRLDPKGLQPGDDWPQLHDNYRDVLRKLEESAG